MFSLQGRAAILTLLPLLIAGAYGFALHERQQSSRKPVDIGIEHTSPAAVTLTYAVGMMPQFIDVSNDGKDTIFISLPGHWERGEVRGGPLASIVENLPMFGYRRWEVPAGLTVAFRNTQPWGGMNIHNPSGLPVRLTVITVNMEKDSTTKEVRLLSDSSIFIP